MQWKNTYHSKDKNMKQNYYIKDLLGNVRETYVHPDANYKECVERTQYYPSGLPWAERLSDSFTAHPWKYNSKEYVEMHGYDVYEYGARGYYATIGRFTSIDPLCEQTPWQSPYVYANNNWVNNIDWMGMSADVYTSVDPEQIAKLLAFLSNGNSLDDYDFEGEGWDVTEDWTFDESEGKLNIYVNHISGEIVPGLGGYIIPDAYVMVLSYYIEDLRKGHQLEESDVLSIIGLTNDIVENYRCNDLYWIGKNGKLYFWYMAHKQGGYAYSRKVVEKSMETIKKVTKPIGRVIAVVSIIEEGGDIFINREITWANAANIVLTGLSLGLSFVPGVGPAIVVATIGVITTADLIVGWTTDSSLIDKIDKPIVKW